jgi:dihydroorotase
MIVRYHKGGSEIDEIVFRRWSNFHLHCRNGPVMRAVVPQIMRTVKYGLWMPNTQPPIFTLDDANRYDADVQEIIRQHDLKARTIKTVYLNKEITPKMVEQMAGMKIGIKYYPPVHGATTGSGHGIPLSECHEVLEAMQEYHVPLLGHFESPIDRFGRELPHREREDYFAKLHFPWLRNRYPMLNISCEHITTKAFVDHIMNDDSGYTAGTVTPQGLLFHEVDGAIPNYSWSAHLKCMPIVKPKEDQEAVLDFATSGDSRVFAGDDTAPHLESKKKAETFDGIASGCWLPHSPALYALAFSRVGALDERFERFMSLNGPAWWDLPPPDENDTLVIKRVEDGTPEPLDVPELNDRIIPLGFSQNPDRFKPGFQAF